MFSLSERPSGCIPTEGVVDHETELAGQPQFARFLAPLYQKPWAVHAKPAFGGVDQSLKYLARYTYRVAINNEWIESLEEGQVTFRNKDYARGHRRRRMTLPAHEFLRRFLCHVLPRGFVRIRSFGFLANRIRDKQLALCCQLLRALERISHRDVDKMDGPALTDDVG